MNRTLKIGLIASGLSFVSLWATYKIIQYKKEIIDAPARVTVSVEKTLAITRILILKGVQDTPQNRAIYEGMDIAELNKILENGF